MTHTPQKCKICGEYHCLAGCVPVEQCYAKAREKRSAEQTKEVKSMMAK